MIHLFTTRNRRSVHLSMDGEVTLCHVTVYAESAHGRYARLHETKDPATCGKCKRRLLEILKNGLKEMTITELEMIYKYIIGE